MVRFVDVSGAKPNLLGYLLHVRLTDPDDRDETNLGNWLWDGGEIKVLLQILLPVAECRHRTKTQIFTTEIGAQRVRVHFGIDIARHIPVYLVRADISERAVSRRETIVVAFARYRQTNRPRLARRNDELQPACESFATIDLLPCGQVRHKSVPVVVESAETQADLLVERAAGIQPVLLRIVLTVSQSGGSEPLRAWLKRANIDNTTWSGSGAEKRSLRTAQKLYVIDVVERQATSHQVRVRDAIDVHADRRLTRAEAVLPQTAHAELRHARIVRIENGEIGQHRLNISHLLDATDRERVATEQRHRARICLRGFRNDHNRRQFAGILLRLRQTRFSNHTNPDHHRDSHNVFTNYPFHSIKIFIICIN